jgi:choice-of-anchor B domain-containing protein
MPPIVDLVLGSSPRRRAWLAGAVLVATPALLRADPDWLKLKDRRPPYLAAPVTGQAIKPDPLSNTAFGFPAQGIILQSWLPLNVFPDSQISAADVWGYTSPSGREYAIMGVRRGTVFVEVTDPVNPALVGYIQGSNSLWHDNAVVGHYAYLVSDSQGVGIQIADLSQIDAGVVTLAATRAPAGLSTVHTIVSNPDSGYLYLCGTNINNGGLTALRTSGAGASPTNPVIAGAWTTRYVHEAQVVTYTSGPYAGREIAFCFTGGPAAGYAQNGGLDIVDVTDKANMVLLGGLRYAGLRFCHQGWLSEDRRYLYINDELDEGSTVSVTTTRIVDVSDLSAPTLAGAFTNNSPAVDHNLYVKGNLIFEGNYRSGLRVFDASNPLAPVEIAFFDTFPDNDRPNFNGVWGNYPFFPSGTILVSDIERGLFVLRLDQSAAVVSYPAGRPDRFDPGAPGEVIVQITTTASPLDPDSVRLFASINGGPFAPNAMIPLGGGLFRGTTPPAPCGATVRYYVHAATVSGALIADPPLAPNDRHFARAASAVSVLVSNDMDADAGWTVGDPSDPDTATGGIWNRMRPQATSGQPGDDHTRAGAHACWVTNGNAGAGDGSNDVDNGKTTVMTPPYNLAAHPEARIGYWRWYSNHSSTSFGNNASDVFVVAVSNDGGATWTTAETVGPGGAETVGDWYYHEFRVADIAAPSAAVRVRFVASDVDPQSIVEACVDDFVIVSCQCLPVCRADWDHNGLVTPADVAAFVNAWFQDLAAGTFAADFDGIGGVNPADVAAFVAAWVDALTTGC